VVSLQQFYARARDITRMAGAAAILGGAIVTGAGVGAAWAQEDRKVSNPIAVFAALDKVTARISRLEVPIDATVTFGALQISPKVCYTRPETLRPKTTSFVVVQEEKLDETNEQIFSGWMLAESPGLHGVEHPVFDVWLTGCARRMTQPSARPSVKLEQIGGPNADQPKQAGMPLPVRKTFAPVRRARRRSLR